jgi:hypothetical protein
VAVERFEAQSSERSEWLERAQLQEADEHVSASDGIAAQPTSSSAKSEPPHASAITSALSSAELSVPDAFDRARRNRGAQQARSRKERGEARVVSYRHCASCSVRALPNVKAPRRGASGRLPEIGNKLLLL